MAKRWFVRAGGKEHGPFTLEQLRAFAVAGKLSPTVQLRGESDSAIVSVQQVSGLFLNSSEAPVAKPEEFPSIQPTPVRRPKSRAKSGWWANYWKTYGTQVVLTGCGVAVCLIVAIFVNRPWESELDKVRAYVRAQIAEEYGKGPSSLALKSLDDGRYAGSGKVGDTKLTIEATARAKRGRKLGAILNLGAYDIQCRITEGSSTPGLGRITVPGTKVSFVPPPGFSVMSAEDMDAKWSRDRPRWAVANPSGGTTVAFDVKDKDISGFELAEVKASWVKLFSGIVPGIVWHQAEIIDVAGNDWILLELSSAAVDTGIHNLMLITPYGKKMLLFNFNSTTQEFEAYKDVLQASANTIRISK